MEAPTPFDFLELDVPEEQTGVVEEQVADTKGWTRIQNPICPRRFAFKELQYYANDKSDEELNFEGEERSTLKTT